MSVDLTVPACSDRYLGLNPNREKDVVADAPLTRSGSLDRCHPVDPAVGSSDCPGVGFRFSRPTRDLQYSEDNRTAVAVGCFEQETRENGVEDQVLHIRWVGEVAAHDPPRVDVVVDLCHREAQGRKCLWAKGDHSCPQGPAEAVEHRQVAHHQEVEVMRLLLVVLLETRPVLVAVRRRRTRVCREEHHPEQPRRGRMPWSRNC